MELKKVLDKIVENEYNELIKNRLWVACSSPNKELDYDRIEH